MMPTHQHHHEPSIPHIRLSQPLPPLPLSLPMNDLRPHPQLSISTQIPYHDDLSHDAQSVAEHSPSQPPQYMPMYDYLRSHQQQQQRQPSRLPPGYECPIPTSTDPSIPQEAYRDEPFVVSIIEHDATQAPPPSYNELYQENEREMQRLMRQFETEATPAEQTEELVKWVVAMLLICLTIAAVGTAFNWGRPSCVWPNRSASNC